MEFLEKNLEELIYQELIIGNVDKLTERGLELYYSKPKFIRRQFKIGNYGTVDLITVEKIDIGHGLSITVFELKKKLINIDTVIQGLRYCKGIKRYLSDRKDWMLGEQYEIHLVLIGSEINSNSDWVYLTDFLNTDGFNLSIFIYKYSFDGLEFKPDYTSDYYLANDGFQL